MSLSFPGLNVKAIWHLLYPLLDLPENLIFMGHQRSAKYNKSIMADIRDSSSASKVADVRDTSSSSGSHSNPRLAKVAGPPAQSLRFHSMYLEVLRSLAAGKMICFCLDDLQFADEESVELISSIITANIRVVLITTCRREEELPSFLKPVLDWDAANVTRLNLKPLSEQDVVDYVASTLYRSPEYVFPLAAVALEKTHGNPFYLRQMLDLCYRKHCLWFNWQISSWEFNLDRVFAEFESETYGEFLTGI